MTLRPLMLISAVAGILGSLVAAYWMFEAKPWEPPAIISPDPAALKPATVPRFAADAAVLNAIVERPLFIPDRRPPALVNAAAEAGDEAEKRDVFADVQLLGILGEGAGGLVILNKDGVTKRLRAGEDLDGWQLAGIEGRIATFSRGRDKRRDLVMVHALQRQNAPLAAKADGVAAKAAVPEQGGGAALPPSAASRTAEQRPSVEELIAIRRARRAAPPRARGN